MIRAFRAALVVTAIVTLLVSAALFWQMPWATSLWLWPQASALSNIFVASIGAAIAVPLLWLGLSGELGAIMGGVYNLLLTFAGGAISLFIFAGRTPDPARFYLYAGVLVAAFLLTVGIFLYSRRFTIDNPQPLPPFVRWSFALFAAILIPVAYLLLLRYPTVFPWPLPPAMSVLYGWIFLGASLYFIYGWLRPSWQNAKGQLLGFLAYDLVLIVPYVNHLSAVQPAHRTSLTVYLGVILFSSLLAIYFLFIHAPTRLWRLGD